MTGSGNNLLCQILGCFLVHLDNQSNTLYMTAIATNSLSIIIIIIIVIFKGLTKKHPIYLFETTIIDNSQV